MWPRGRGREGGGGGRAEKGVRKEQERQGKGDGDRREPTGEGILITQNTGNGDRRWDGRIQWKRNGAVSGPLPGISRAGIPEVSLQQIAGRACEKRFNEHRGPFSGSVIRTRGSRE